MSGSREPARDPVSPELVLVAPPEVAREARDELAEAPPERAWAAIPAASSPDLTRRAPKPPPYPKLVADDAPAFVSEAAPAAGGRDVAASDHPPRAGRRRFLRGAAVVAACAVGAAGFFVAKTQTRDRTTASRSPTTASVHATSAAAGPTPTAAKRDRNTTSQSRTSASPSTTGAAATPTAPAAAETSPAASKKQSRTRSRPASTAPVAGFVPARAWTWPPSSGARAYVMTFALNGRTVFRMRTSRPRLVLPRSFRFRPGTYRWTVRRVPARDGAAPVVDSRFTLTPAAAAQANR